MCKQMHVRAEHGRQQQVVRKELGVGMGHG